MARTDKTEHSFFNDKVQLRVDHLPDGTVTLLDAYAGEGLIWKEVARVTGRKINRIPIDKKHIDGFHLPGDNISYLSAVASSDDFNAIDLDAYGIPFPQIDVVLRSSFKGWVYMTFIQTYQGYGSIPMGLLVKCGFTRRMVKKVPTLLYKHGWDYFLSYLAGQGITGIYHRGLSRKHYAAFLID